MLREAGILSATEHADLCRALGDIGREHAGAEPPQSSCEDLHTWIESELVRRAGEAGRRIHTARSRNDQVATLLILYLLDASKQLTEQGAGVVERLCNQATTWSDVEFPLHTHTQFAAPGSLGAWFLRFAVALDRSLQQLDGMAQAWRQSCPLGSGAVAGSSIPIDRQRQAELLGFAAPSWSALDATTSRDECLQFLASLAHQAVHLQSFATDGILFAHPALGFLRYPHEFATGSSMMPNKSNPDALELLRGEACSLQSAHAHALLLLKGLPSGYNRDLQCIKPIVHAAASTMTVLLQLTGDFVAAIDFDRERLEAGMALGDIGATLDMEARVQAGTPLRQAHHDVAAALAAPRRGVQTVSASATAYRTFGSAQPAEVRRVAAALQQRRTHASGVETAPHRPS